MEKPKNLFAGSQPTFGVSFSVLYARYLGLDPLHCLEAILKEMPIKRLRLMSYWDLHQPSPNTLDFSLLDQQIALAKKYGASVSLCLGYRQPRFPENHQPVWAKALFDQPAKQAWREALYTYISAVVDRYKDNPVVENWQLENEALNTGFGVDGEFSRDRLEAEYYLVKNHDPSRPIIMTTSNTLGIPMGKPRPDIFGFSVYKIQYRGSYKLSHLPAMYYRLRAYVTTVLTARPVFIHELQAEPWGPAAVLDMTLEEQFKSMNADHLRLMVAYAKRIQRGPIYLWGVEWWYWLLTTKHEPSLWAAAQALLND